MKRGAAWLLVLLVAACGPLPRPFQPPAGSAANPLTVPEEMIRVRVETVEDLGEPAASKLAAAAVAALAGLDIPASARPSGASRYVLKGRLVEPLRIEWTLADSAGRPLGTRSQSLEAADLEAGPADDPRLRASADVVARGLAGWIEPEAPSGPAAKPGGLAIGAVTGAPGDGNASLTRSIRLALKTTDVPVVDPPAEALFRLDATVAVEPAVAGRQRVQIAWILVNAAGAPLGRITQDNTLPQGSFDGAWGRLAAEIAAAAAPGIAEAVGRAGTGR